MNRPCRWCAGESLRLVAAVTLACLLFAQALGQEPAFTASPLIDWRFQAWPVLAPAGPHPVAELPDGTIVVGTATGLLRFDGRRMHDLPTPSGAGGVLFLHVDRAGVLHVIRADATHVGLSATDQWVYGEGTPMPPGEGTKGVEPTSVCEDRDGAVWVGRRNGLVSRTEGRKLLWLKTATAATSPDDPPAHVAADREGRVWMARKGCLAVWSDGRWQPKVELATGPLTLATARDGGLWLRIGNPIHRFTEAVGLTQPFSDVVPTIRSLQEDAGGRLWMGTSRYGLVAWDGARLATAATTGRSIFAVFPDRHGGVWAGTTAGLEHGRPRIVRRVEMPTIKPLRSVAATADGELWFITLDGELGARGDDASLPSRQPERKYGVLTALSIADDGTLWLGTQDGGVIRMAGANPDHLENLATPPDVRGHPVHAFAAAASGGVWAALGPHLLWTDGPTWQRTAWPTPTTTAISLLAADATGGVWAATSDGELAYATRPRSTGAVPIAIELRTPPDFPANAVVTAICPLANGSVWIVTRQSGLWRHRDGRWSHVETSLGLPSSTLLAALPDDHGRMWFAGSRVFFAAAIDELEAAADGRSDWVHCWVASGEDDLAFFDPTIVPPGIASRDAQGRVLVVLPTGLAICEPDRLPVESAAPVVDVVEVRGDGHVISRSPQSGYALPATRTVRVPADTRVVACALADTGFAESSNARIQHRLDGIDGEWIDTPPDRVVSYERLPAGRHSLQLRSSTNAASWTSETGGFLIDVEPRLWERPWFRGGVIAGVAALAAGLAYAYQAFLANLKITRLRQAAALDRERMRIARDMHDELGTSLTQISLLTELIRSRTTPETAHQLEDVTSIARATVSSLDEIVWAVNPKHDTLSHLLSYVTLHASQTLGRLGIGCHVDAPDSIEPCATPTEFRRSVLFIVKEAIANVIRHADARQVAITIRVVDGRLILTIADDGRGPTAASPSARPRGTTGLDNMRQRAAELGGTCTISRPPGGGTSVSLDVPLPNGRRPTPSAK